MADSISVSKLPESDIRVEAGDHFPEFTFTIEEVKRAFQTGAYNLKNNILLKPAGGKSKGTKYPHAFQNRPATYKDPNKPPREPYNFPTTSELTEYPVRHPKATIFTGQKLARNPERVVFGVENEEVIFCGLITHAGIIHEGLKADGIDIDEFLNQQARLLQPRNSSFQSAFLYLRLTSLVTGSPSHIKGAFLWLLGGKDSSKASERQLHYGEGLPLNPVNILQETHNTARQRGVSLKPGFGAIFQDTTATGKANREIGSPLAEEPHSDWLPPILKFLPKTLKLNPGSENDRTTSPLSSLSCSRPIQGRRISWVNPRSTSLEVTKYIEHLKNQLTANAKFESYASPAANNARSAEVKAPQSNLAAYGKKYLIGKILPKGSKTN
ncbi:hypothetical protein MMC31_000213 [Peltigera leucophlebia]|nr:hypothetical protein [Peltigera leucophlebia]